MGVYVVFIRYTHFILFVSNVRGIFIYFWLLMFFLFLAVFLLNDAAVAHVDILSFVSVGHVVENARLVDVDGAATEV